MLGPGVSRPGELALSSSSSSEPTLSFLRPSTWPLEDWDSLRSFFFFLGFFFAGFALSSLVLMKERRSSTERVSMRVREAERKHSYGANVLTLIAELPSVVVILLFLGNLLLKTTPQRKPCGWWGRTVRDARKGRTRPSP